jgi:hypothetical protein
MTDPTQSAGGAPQLMGLTGILDDLTALADRDGHPDVQAIVTALGHAGFQPLMILPAMIVVSPLSGIFLLSSLCGISVFLVAIQMVLHRRYLWLPGWILRRSVADKRLHAAVRRMRPAAAWLDGHSHQRLTFLTHQPFLTLLQIACALCGAAMPFLELLPFTSSFLGAAICLMGLAMLTRDGLWAALALVPVGAATALLIMLVL